MAAAEAASAGDAGPQMSEALRELLAAEAELQSEHRRANSAQSSGTAASSEPAAAAQSQASAEVELGQNLDITSSDVSLDGLDEQLDKFADHEVVRAILDQVRCGRCSRSFAAFVAAFLPEASLGDLSCIMHIVACL